MPNTLITPKKLQEILTEVKRSLHITNPDYILALDRLHIYYDMQLVTFGVDSDMNLIIQFPVVIQPYTQKPLIYIPAGDCSSSYSGPKYQGSIIHTLENQKALYSLKF